MLNNDKNNNKKKNEFLAPPKPQKDIRKNIKISEETKRHLDALSYAKELSHSDCIFQLIENQAKTLEGTEKVLYETSLKRAKK